MFEFVKRNLVWISVFLCLTGIVLSIVGIPTQQPICFFIGIIFSLPTIAYLIYQVFFDKGQAEINLQNTTTPTHTGNVTTVLDKKENLILMNTEEDDLEPLYNGCATQQEIENQLYEILKAEHKKMVAEVPAEPVLDETAIQVTTQGELLRQREIQTQAALAEPISMGEQAPLQIIKTTNELAPTPEPQLEPEAVPEITTAETIIMPEVVTDELEPVSETIPTPMAEVAVAPTTPRRIIPHDTAASKALRAQKALEKKTLLAQENLEKYFQRFFLEVAACFTLDRNIYKDNCGIAPYNKLSIDKNTLLPEYVMSATKGRLYKFCTYLIDVERFVNHSELYDDFVTAIEKGIPLARISETLHAVYRRKFKKDFILNLSNREDWDNIIILVFNHYILDNDNFKDVFTHIPFEIPVAFNEENVVDYLKDSDVQERFLEHFPSFNDLGIPTVWEAIYICFINSIKNKLSIAQLETAALKEYKKVARALKRADNAKRKNKQ